MKFRKSLIAAMLTGAGVIAVAPAINAAEYSTSVGGNIRVEGTTVTKGSVATSTTAFGGEDDESTTGGDTFLQWNHNFANDEGTTTGGGFLRFRADGNIRFNVNARSELGNYVGELKAEWEQLGFSGLESNDDGDGVEKKQTGRDQFAKLTHAPSGVYYKIGREQWLDNNKGYTSDFLSQTEKMAFVSGENRFSAHALGWSGNGVDVALLIQRDNDGQISGRPSGQKAEVDGGGNLGDINIPLSIKPDVPTSLPGVDNATLRGATLDGGGSTLGDVSGFGILFSYDGGDSVPVQVDLNYGTGSVKSNLKRGIGLNDARDNPVKDANGDDVTVAPVDQSVDTTFTQLHLAFPVSGGKYVPFVNYGNAKQTYKLGDVKVLDTTLSGWNLGASIGLGASDLVVAYGTQTRDYSAAAAAATTNRGFDLIWATNQEPLKVSLAYSSITDKSQYGVRLDFGF